MRSYGILILQKTEKIPIESMPKIPSQSTPEATWPTNYAATV